MNTQILGFVSAILNFISAVPYVYAVYKRKAIPNRVTWFIWMFLAWSLVFSSFASGARSTVLWMVSSAIISSTIFILSIWRGTWERDVLDISCFVLGIFGVLLWYVSKQASISVYVSSIVDIIAILPTVRKTWKSPLSEPRTAWTIGFIAALINVFAIDAIRLVVIVQPIVVVIWHVMILIPLYLSKHQKYETVR